MKHHFSPFIILTLLIIGTNLYSQQTPRQPLRSFLSIYDSVKLSELPELKLPGECTRRLIPPVVDNSLLPWFRPVFQQESSECGQASSIGYAFTYEIDFSRNLPANISTNQYTPFFAYNFINTGSGDVGVSSFETYEVLKHAGCPTVNQYGGMGYGGPTRWMHGYQYYYNAMKNRISGVYKIQVNTTEGIQTLKNWLYDHGNGSSSGGVATFYATGLSINFFPTDVPEAGKNVITWWGNSANHSMTIVGYNDSIRWDYNGDGLYTNNIDLNSDGLIDPRDWEIGGFKLANSYGNDWADQGFSYLMTKSLADNYGYGGIWSNTVIVISVRENYEPQLTAKVNLSYGCRNKLRIMAGVSSNTSSTEPDFILHFPVFDFQGGCKPMQGQDTSETIEIGLDLNPLLNYTEPGQPAKYFLLIQENDPDSTNEGTINSFSIIDYTNGINELNSNINALPISNNNLTLVSINTSVNYNEVEISTDSIPEITLYTDFSYPLQSVGGTPPYRWHIADNYTRIDSTSLMEMADSIKLELSSAYNGRKRVELPFSFPFYGEDYHEVYATVDGYLIFEDSEIPWPYFIEGRTYFIETPMIAAASCSPFIVFNSSQGVWYEEADDHVTFRWYVQVYGVSNSYFNATVKLYQDGKIEINYGDFNLPSWVKRFAGISKGDGENYELVSNDADFSPIPDQLISFIPETEHQGVEITDNGILTGNCDHPLTNSPITICSSDQNNIRDYNSFFLTVTGLQMDFEVVSGDDHQIDFGEEVFMTLNLTNRNDYALSATSLSLSTVDTNFIIIDDTAHINGLQPGETIQITDAFLILTSNHIRNQHPGEFIIHATAQEGNWERTITVTGNSPVLSMRGHVFYDGNNGSPEAGENIELHTTIINKGGSTLLEATAMLESSDPYLTVLSTIFTIGTIASEDTASLVFEIALAPDVTIGHLINLILNITGNNDYSSQINIPVHAGIALENFESTDLSILNWQTGNHPWFIEKGNAYEGNYCIRSAQLGLNQYSSLKIDWNVLYNDSISFWFKTVADEANKLRFDIRNSVKANWYGTIPWSRVSYYVPAGETYFRWNFYKGNVPTYNEDCARLDYIVFPPLDGSISVEKVLVNQAKLSVYPNPSSDYLTIKYSLTDKGPVSIRIYDINGKCIFIDKEKILLPGDYMLKPNLGSLSPGMYTIQLITAQGTISRKMSKL